jgi:acyl-CoA reductase-like NAD-dependent aldehyde dehydrogenase
MSTPFASKSPIDGSPLSAVEATPIDEIPAIVARAKTAQAAWGARRVAERVKIIAAAKDRILDRAKEIAAAVHAEVGKPEVEALLGEVLPSADVVDFWTQGVEELLEPQEIFLDRTSYPKKRGVIHREARGVVVVIMPWNFPFALPLRTIIPALLAGNAIVFKPSEVSPRGGKLVADIFEGLLPEGLFSLVQGGGDAGAALCASAVDLVVFTGSVASGRKVAVACAERLTPCSLELGGKDAAIVLADANLDRTANGLVWGAMMNCGQNCAGVERVYVEESVAKALTEKIVAAASALRTSVDIGPLTTEAQRSIVVRHVDAARAEGATVLAGGTAGDVGYAYAPTVLEVATEDLDVMKDETFGPVLPIAVVKDADEAIQRANASRFGLTASVWTKSISRGQAIAKKLRAGVVTINNHSFTGAIPAAPWSGMGESGYGITSSPLALDALTRPRFVLVDRNRAKKELWWYPYTPALLTVGFALATLRSAHSGIGSKIRAFFELLAGFSKRWKVG